MSSTKRQKGYIMLPVVLAISLMAVLAFMMNHENAVELNNAGGELEAEKARYAAEAGLNHALWQIGQNGCGPYSDITDEPFGNHNYSATITTNSAGGTTTLHTVPVIADAFIKEDTPGQNYGSDAQLDVYNKWFASEDKRALYLFDIENHIPAGAAIVSAVAKLFVLDTTNYLDVGMHQVTADWTESGATWDNIAANHNTSRIAPIPKGSPVGQYVSVNITSLVQGWVNGSVPIQGIMLKQSELANNDPAQYTSREDGNANKRPLLEVTVADGALANRAAVSATGTLTNGITRTRTREEIPLYQPPSMLVWQPGSELQDAFIWDGAHAGKNFGVSPILNIKNDRNVLIRFNLSALPPGARIANVTLGLYLEGGIGVVDGVLDLHRLSRSWVEGIYNDQNPPAGGGVTYQSYDGQTNWDTFGGDYDPTIIDSITLPSMVPGWYEWDVTNQINAWLDGEPNDGFLLREGGGDAGDIDFTSSDSPTSEQHPKLTITLACECGVTCLIPQGSGKVLLTVGDTANLDPADVEKKGLFEAWGYSVNLIDDNDDQAAFDNAMADNDLAYISDTASSWTLGNKLLSTDKGVVNEEGGSNDYLGISNSDDHEVGKSIELVDNSHYITELLPGGVLPLYLADMESLTATGTLAAGLQTLGNFNGSPAIVLVDQGGLLHDGSSQAAGRRVMLPIGRHDKFNWDYLNNNGRLIVQRALEWAKPLACSDGEYRDEFDPVSFGNNDGSLSWSGDWIEVDGDGAGPNTGNVWITNGQLRLDDRPDTGGQPSAARRFNLEGATAAIVSFDFALGSGTEQGGDVAVLEISTDGTNWTELEDFSQWDGGYSGSRTYDLTTYLAVDTQIRFRIAAAYGGNNEYLAIDNLSVGVCGTVENGLLPMAHWKLDDGTGTTAVDSAGGHDGTLTNSPAWTTGKHAGALDFDGSDDYVSVPHDDTLSLTEVMTFTAWVNASSYGSTYQTILAKDGGGSGSNFWFGAWQSELVFGFYADGSFREVYSTGLNLQAGTWYHLAASFDNATDEVRLYVDGAQVHSGTLGFSPTAVTANLTIGRSPDGEYWRGLLDDVRIYDKVLDATAVAELAGAGSGGVAPPGEVVFEEFTEASLGSNGIALDIAKPGGTATGDLLIAAIATDGQQELGISPPAGWNLINQGMQSDRVTLGVWWKIAGSSEPAQYHFTWPEDEQAYGWVMRFTGQDALNPINVSASEGGTSNAPTSPAVTTTVPNTMILRIGGFDDDDITIGEPGLTGHNVITMDESGTGKNSTSGGAGYLTQAGAGDSSTSYFSQTKSEEYRTVTIAIAPDTGG